MCVFIIKEVEDVWYTEFREDKVFSTVNSCDMWTERKRKIDRYNF
jgi:hypothetical protein